MNSELLNVVLDRAEALFESAGELATQVRSWPEAVELDAEATHGDAGLGELIVQAAFSQKELLYRLDQAVRSEPTHELSGLAEPVRQIRETLSILLVAIERSATTAQHKKLLANLHKPANDGRSCILKLRGKQQATGYGKKSHPATQTKFGGDVASEIDRIKQQRCHDIYTLHFGMPECLTGEEMEVWAADFQPFMNCAVRCIQYFEEQAIANPNAREASFAKEMAAPEGVNFSDPKGGLVIRPREMLFGGLEDQAGPLGDLVHRLTTALASQTNNAPQDLIFWIEKDRYRELWKAVDGTRSMLSDDDRNELESLMVSVYLSIGEAGGPERAQISISVDQAFKFLQHIRQLERRLDEILSSGRRALRIGVAAPDFGSGSMENLPTDMQAATITEDKLTAPAIAKAAYDYAMREIPGADELELAQLLVILKDKWPFEEKSPLPGNVETFRKYLNRAGVHLRKLPKANNQNIVDLDDL